MSDGRAQALARVAALYPVRVGVGITDPRAPHKPMFHVEHAAIRDASVKRQREFLAGRYAARQAQAALGLIAQPVRMAADRAPIWPPGLRGAISHTSDICVAVVSNDPAIAALGLDVEEAAALPTEILDTVLLPDEQRWINQQTDPGAMARLFFSAKECAYKAQYPLSGQLFGFETIAITADPVRKCFSAQFTRSVPPFANGNTLTGRFSIGGGLILTGIAIAA